MADEKELFIAGPADLDEEPELSSALDLSGLDAVQQGVLSVLKRLIKEHKRVIFDGDNYSEEWHAEADDRGLPNLKDSVAAFQVLRAKKNSDLFRKYGVLNRSEYESRIHVAIEKFVKQLGIEAETMVSIAKSQILPAALEHQRRVADAVAATKAAGVDASDSTHALREFVVQVAQFRAGIAEVERLAAHHEADPAKHAAQLARELKPAMARLRETGDLLETSVAADLWRDHKQMAWWIVKIGIVLIAVLAFARRSSTPPKESDGED